MPFGKETRPSGHDDRRGRLEEVGQTRDMTTRRGVGAAKLDILHVIQSSFHTCRFLKRQNTAEKRIFY
jgi:hypothetical protein